MELPTLDYNAMEEITVALWVKEEIMHHSHGESYLAIGKYPSGRIFIHNASHASTMRYWMGTSTINAPYTSISHDFVHYAMTYSGGVQRAYRDGVLIGETNAVLQVDHPQYAALGFHHWSGGYSTRLTAVFDDLRIYDRALSDSEITGLAGQGSDPGLVAYYPFSGNAADESGNGHHGTVNGATLTTDRFGNAASAYDFDGVSDYINCGNIIDGYSNYTISAWINIDRYTDSRYMGPWGQQRFADPTPGVHSTISMRTTSDPVYGFGMSMRWADGTLIETRVGHPVPVSEWHLITQTYDGVAVRQYDNGVLVNAVISEGHTVSNSWDFLIGKLATYAGNTLSTVYFAGEIDDLRVYDRALLADEIAGLYAEGDDGLVASYPFNGNANDESGNGADGIIEGALPATDRHGNENGALLFDEDRYVRTTASSGSVDITGRISMAAWINPSQFETQDGAMGMRRTILRKMSLHNSYGYVFGIDKDGLLNVFFGNSSDGGPAVTALNMTPLPTNQWSHVAATYDGALVTFYVDGVLVDVQPCDAPLRSTSENLCIGRIPNADTAYFYGAIDDIHLYDRSLLADEIAGLFAEGDDGLVANYPFNGNAADESGNGHDGTVNGATLTSDRFGHADSAYHFDGVNDYIDIGEFAGIRSVSMWVKQGTRSEFDFYFGHNTFRVYASTLASGRLMFGDGSPSKAYSTVSMDDYEDQWVHVVAVGNGLNSKVYLNGVNVTESSGNVGPALASVVNLGRWPGPIPAATHYMNGDMDDVHVYDRVLSESEVLELYAEESVSDCILPDWLTVEPLAGTVTPGESMDINLAYYATNMVAGDYAEHVLQLFSNDPDYPVVDIPVSMWVMPSAPVLFAEPQCTVGKSNEIAWIVQDGPVEYWAEAEAMRHTSPSFGTDSNSVPAGWLDQNRFTRNPEDWQEQIGWISDTRCMFTGLLLNTMYQYRVKASVMTDIGRLESSWSEWVESCQVPVLINHDAGMIPGWWKRMYFGTEDNFIGAMDSDGDQLSDFYEYISGSNPHDASSKFKIGKAKALQDGSFVVDWTAVTGRVYSVYWSPDVGGPYELLEANITYPQNSYTDTVHHAESGAFYRIDVRLEN